jgi:anthranilate synthase
VSHIYSTARGVEVTRTEQPADEAMFTELTRALDTRRGGVLGSGMVYPGRYDRWALGYIDPPIEITARGRDLTVAALNQRGRLLLIPMARALAGVGRPLWDEDVIRVHVAPGTDGFAEEDRCRQPTVFSAIREIIALFSAPADPHLGLCGAFGYDLAFQFEPIRLGTERPRHQRDLVLHLPDEILVIDRRRETATRYSYEFAVDAGSTAGLPKRTDPSPAPAPPAELPPQPVPGVYADVVRKAKERFLAGDLFEVVPGHVMHGKCASPAAFYERLRRANPAPYEFFFNLGQGEYLVGASPEMFVRVTGTATGDGGAGLRVETCPISGTIRRGTDPLTDADQVRTLLNSAKDESELTMCTDVDRNDKSRVCVPGTVRVIGRRQIEMYSRLIHTVDHVEGYLRPGLDALDAFLTHMWAVTVTGAPKVWAMQFIEDNEPMPRRWYGGAVGMLGFDGSMNTGLTLRTAQISGGVAAVRAGATLLYDSDPEEEERETHLKARALLEAVKSATADTGTGSLTVIEPAGAGRNVLVVDHQDSFVNTLADYFRQQGAAVTTRRSGFPAGLLDEHRPDLVVMSPGPGRPADFDCSALLDHIYARDLPVFGVCLGLQAMVQHAGGVLGLLAEPAHGKPGRVKVLGGGLFDGLPDEFTAARYHSLHATPDQVRAGFTVSAVIGDVVMAIEDTANARFAVQFHPESILTAAGGHGSRLIGNVLRLTRKAS